MGLSLPVLFVYNESMRNVIFDLGNVLVSFQPDAFLKDLFEDQTQREICKKALLDTYWHAYDHGDHTSTQLVELASQAYPAYRKTFEKMMEKWVTYVRPIQETKHLISLCKKKGLRCYILSNIPKECYEYLKMNTNLFSQVDGGIYSYQVRLIKPDKRIYQTLLETYSLKAEESLFIDDDKKNIDAAKALGFETYHCTNCYDMATWLEKRIYEL